MLVRVQPCPPLHLILGWQKRQSDFLRFSIFVSLTGFAVTSESRLASCGFGGIASIRADTSSQRFSSSLELVVGRQPYLPTYAKKPYAVGALILKDSPRFCEAIGKCIAIWTQVDNEMGCLLGILLGANSDATIEVFLSLRRASSQREALAAAALHTLQGHELAACNAILAVYKSLERQRNDLGSRLNAASMRREQRGKGRPDNFWRACHSVLRCA
jgi:hypothetical protein